jgi:hypothetical protein
MYDPDEQTLDLTHAEKLRATALMMAIRYHVETIVKDAPMLQTLLAQGRSLTPTDEDAVIRIAKKFGRHLREDDDDEPEVRSKSEDCLQGAV